MSLHPVRVLVVEDDEDDFVILTNVLRRVEGGSYAVTRARDFGSGLAAIARGEHDVCFLDYRLGAGDGLELMQEARARGHEGPYVLLTGQESRELDLKAMHGGADDFLPKSRIDPPTLERVIRYALERHRGVRELRQAHEFLEARVEKRTAELTAALKELKDASQLKDEFLATLSHELRTPLNVIIGYADLLSVKEHVDPEVCEGLEIIRRNAKVQAQLIGDLLDVSRIVTGKLVLASTPVDLAGIIKGAVDSLRLAASAQRLQLSLALDAGSAPVLGDPARLQQVVWNLLSNAIKFTAAQGTITVTLSVVDRLAQITVSDTGQGIDACFLPHVFDRFRQADAKITRRHGGLGLGLSIVRQLVEMHGGRIEASSAGRGKGATFTVRIPLTTCEAARAQPQEQQPLPSEPARKIAFRPGKELAGRNILVVDDAPDVLAVVRCILRHAGATVTTALSANEARARIDEHRPDVILSDIGMPDEDGYEFMRSLRRAEATLDLPRIPAAAMTAYARDQERLQALQAGYDMHVTKPVDVDSLVHAVMQLVSLRAVQERAAQAQF